MFLIRKRVNTGLAMLAGAGLLILMNQLNWLQVVSAVRSALLDPSTLPLTLVVLLIPVLGHIMKANGSMDLLVQNLLKLIGDPRWSLALVSGVLGLLSVPGGAMMAVPMVERIGDQVGMDKHHMTASNMVFRHLWYVLFPIIPSVIMAAALAGVTPLQLVALNIPVALVGIFAGWWFILRPIKVVPGKSQFSWAALGNVVYSLSPLVLVLIFYLVFDLWFPLSLVLGIIWALGVLPGAGEGSIVGRTLAAIGKRGAIMVMAGVRWPLLLVVPGIFIFKEVLDASQVVTAFAGDLAATGLAIWLLLLTIPLLIGLLLGSHEATIAIAMPIFVPLLPEAGWWGGLGLLYVASTMGYFSSPLHLCLILTREYFGANLGKVYRYMLPVAFLMLIAGLLLALLRGI
jgi:integral membrane protein (TIGR00529 family)